jgi:hypothetical protein
MKGRKFGRWTVLSKAGRGANGDQHWNCICECGMRGTIAGHSLRSGNSRSCGCLKMERAGLHNWKHGMVGTPTYNSYRSMLWRCSPSATGESRKKYYERGIKVCLRWQLSFLAFLRDMGIRPPGKTLDRRDNNGSYTPKNCRWASAGTQAINTRRHPRYKK